VEWKPQWKAFGEKQVKNGVWCAMEMMLPSININIEFAIVIYDAEGNLIVQQPVQHKYLLFA
jgi:hypothetical protein